MPAAERLSVANAVSSTPEVARAAGCASLNDFTSARGCGKGEHGRTIDASLAALDRFSVKARQNRSRKSLEKGS